MNFCRKAEPSYDTLMDRLFQSVPFWGHLVVFFICSAAHKFPNMRTPSRYGRVGGFPVISHEIGKTDELRQSGVSVRLEKSAGGGDVLAAVESQKRMDFIAFVLFSRS
jgi:hypothetical protein